MEPEGSLPHSGVPATCPYPQPARSTPNPTSWRPTLILSSHLRLVLPSCLFPSGFPTKPLYTPLLSTIRVTCPAHLIILDLTTRKTLGEEYNSLSSSLCSFLHSFLGQNIPLSTLFSNILSLRSSIHVSDQVLYPCKTKGKIIALYILIFKFLDSKMEDKRFCTEWWQAFPDFNLLLIYSWIQFWFVKVAPKYLNSSASSKDLLSIFILWFCPAFWSGDMTMYLVLSAFTSSPVTLLATIKSSAFSFIVCGYTLQAKFNFDPYLPNFTWR